MDAGIRINSLMRIKSMIASMHTAGQRGPSTPKNFPASSLINTEPAKLLASQTDMADHVMDGFRRAAIFDIHPYVVS
jgi:hypothetical protein